MADVVAVYPASQNLQLTTSPGAVVGLVITSTSATPTSLALYDYVGNGSPTPKIFEAVVGSDGPLVIFFADRFAPRFADGLWLISGANLTITIWYYVR